MSQVIDRALPSAPSKLEANGQMCAICQSALPIGAPGDAARTVEWICESCHAPLTGVLLPELAASLGQRVRLAPQVFATGRAEPIPVALRELVEKLLISRRLKQESHERRRNPRVPCNLDAVVVSLNDQWLPCRTPICAVVIDLAAHGLGMMTAQCIKGERFAIQIECPTGPVQLLGQRAWSNFVGDSFQNTGVEFVARLGRRAVAEHSLVG